MYMYMYMQSRVDTHTKASKHMTTLSYTFYQPLDKTVPLPFTIKTLVVQAALSTSPSLVSHATIPLPSMVMVQEVLSVKA